MGKPRAGEIFGILKQMKETFETNLSQSQKDELTAAEDFANLKAAKTEEMKKAQAMVLPSKIERIEDREDPPKRTRKKFSEGWLLNRVKIC